MLTSVALVAAGSFASQDIWIPVYRANPYLNGVIVGVFGIGLLACFWQIEQIVTSVVWIRRFISGQGRADADNAPRLLAPLAGLLRSRSARIQLSTTSARSILDSVASRMDESRDIARYLSNLLIFLGLLGTFFGLATTVPAVVAAIQSLAPAADDGGAEVFRRLIGSLEQQLDGMGTAFSSSLLGLAGSLVVGLLDLMAGHGQNGFFRQLEEWLSGITRVGLGQSESEGESSDSDSSSAHALEGVAEQLWLLRTTLDEMNSVNARSDEAMQSLGQEFGKIAEGMAHLSDSVRWSGEQAEEMRVILATIASGQEELREHFARLALDVEQRETQSHLKSIERDLLMAQDANNAFRQELLEQIGRISFLLNEATGSASQDTDGQG